MAVSLPMEKTEENYFGVTSLVLSLDSLLETALSVVSVPENAVSMICTVDRRPDTGQFGAKIVAYAQLAKEMNYEWVTEIKAPWLISSDKPQIDAMLQDIAVRMTRIREMPFEDRESYWIYGPLPHQGTAFVIIIPKSEIHQPSQGLLRSIHRFRYLS